MTTIACALSTQRKTGFDAGFTAAPLNCPFEAGRKKRSHTANREEETVTRNRRQHGRLAAVSFAVILLLTLTLTACGSSGGGNASASSSSSSSASVPPAVTQGLAQLTTCLRAHGVKVASPANRRAVRTAIRGLSQTQRQAAVTSCQKYVDALLGLRAKNK